MSDWLDRLFGDSRWWRRQREGHWEHRVMALPGEDQREGWMQLPTCCADLTLAYQVGRVTCEEWTGAWQCSTCFGEDAKEWHPRNSSHSPLHGATMA